MSEEEKVEDVQEEPEDEVHEEEMNSEEVYDSISQARVKKSWIFTMISTQDSRFCRIIFFRVILMMEGVPGYTASRVGCPRSGHYVFNKLDQGLSQMIPMVIIKV